MSEFFYLYGIIRADQPLPFGEVEINGKPTPVNTYVYKNLGIINSIISLDDNSKIKATRKNLLAHQKATEKVLEDHTILPFSFGTVVQGDPDINNLIDEKIDEFNDQLDRIEGKVELGLKVMWKDMQETIGGIMKQNLHLQNMKAVLERKGGGDQNEIIQFGKALEDKINEKRYDEKEKILEVLKQYCEDFTENKNITETMILNAAFLVDKAKETQFDRAVEEVDKMFGSSLIMKYVGPLAPFNFI